MCPSVQVPEGQRPKASSKKGPGRRSSNDPKDFKRVDKGFKRPKKDPKRSEEDPKIDREDPKWAKLIQVQVSK